MKKLIPFSILCLAAAFLFSTTLFAQEQTEITVKVKKDGKVVKDTTYQFEDDAEAKHAMKMMNILSGDDEHMMEYHYSMDHKHEGQSKAMVFISEDGGKTTIKEFHGDSLVWIEEGEHPHGEHVIIKKKGDGETFDILIEKDGDGEKVIKKKEVKVIVSGDENGTWHVEGDELEHMDEDVYIISGDDVKLELKEILEEHGDDEKNVKVIVVKKKSDGECDEDSEHEDDHDEDSEHDHDEDGDEEIEVEVEKKVKKKSKMQ